MTYMYMYGSLPYVIPFEFYIAPVIDIFTTLHIDNTKILKNEPDLLKDIFTIINCPT